MSPDRYEYSTGAGRLSGNLQRRSNRLGLPTWGGLLFGGVFVAAGTAIVLVGLKIIPVNPRSVHAPFWVLAAAGASFALGGFVVWGMALRQFAANRRRLEAIRRYPNEPALADYLWHPDGFEVSEWPGVIKIFAMAVGLTIFLSMFNWWAFGIGGPWMVKGIVGLFDFVAVMVWLQAMQQVGRALKFGHSKVQFETFPCFLPDPVAIRWQPFRGVGQVHKGTFTLRCIEEWMEQHGTGKNRTTVLIHNEIWRGVGMFEQPRNFQLRETVDLNFNIPTSARSTDLSADKPVFWELEVKLDLPGLDFAETYLVPIYHRPGSSVSNAAPSNVLVSG
jgi:hypothetical protein